MGLPTQEPNGPPLVRVLVFAVKIALAVLATVVVAQTALSFVRSRAWWVRVFDFPRLQIAVCSMLLLVLFGLTNLGSEESGWWEWLLFALLGGAVLVQTAQILPYTRLWRTDVPTAPADSPPDRRLRMVISNVCLKNREARRWLEVVRAEKPHVIIAVEVDDWWCRQLGDLEHEYPHSVLQAQNNTYGMAIFSRLPLQKTEIKHLIEEDVPSIFTALELPTGRSVRCVALHPRPPRPDIQQDSDLRDAELVRAARIVRSYREPCVVAGDLNDVAWSHTTHLFQRVAQLLDPRVGRGRYSTFHADHRLLRWPLDHVFHSNHFDLVELRRLEHVGSDHFPILVELLLREQTSDRPQVDPMDEEDAEQAQDAVEDSLERRAEESPEEQRDRKREDR